jgi:hypothetical protein
VSVGTEDCAVSGGVDEEPALPEYLYTEDEEPSEESISLGAKLATRFAVSLASSFSRS